MSNPQQSWERRRPTGQIKPGRAALLRRRKPRHLQEERAVRSASRPQFLLNSLSPPRGEGQGEGSTK